MEINKIPIMVIDLSITECFIYDMDSNLSCEEIEIKLIEKGHHLNNFSWGRFNGIINDKRDD